MQEQNSGSDAPLRNATTDAGNILVVGSGELNLNHPYTELWMPDGHVVRLPTAVLVPKSAASASLAAEENSTDAGAPGMAGSDAITIPVVEEQLTVEKRTVPTGIVRLQKTLQKYEEQLDEALAIRTFDVERVVLNQAVDSPPEIRQEGDTTIYSLVEEQLVLTKKLILREEVRVTRREAERRDNRVITLHREHITVTREAVTPEPFSPAQPSDLAEASKI